MIKNKETGQIYNLIKNYSENSNFDKIFEQHGIEPLEKKIILHNYTLFFFLEIHDELWFFSTPNHFLFIYPKKQIPEQLLQLFGLYTTRFENPFQVTSQKLNYTKTKFIWQQVDEMPFASEHDTISITYKNAQKVYTCDLLHVFKNENNLFYRADLRDIDEIYLQDIFNMETYYYPERNFTKPSVFFEFYNNLLVQITKEAPRKMRPVDIEVNVVKKK